MQLCKSKANSTLPRSEMARLSGGDAPEAAQFLPHPRNVAFLPMGSAEPPRRAKPSFLLPILGADSK